MIGTVCGLLCLRVIILEQVVIILKCRPREQTFLYGKQSGRYGHRLLKASLGQ